MRRQILSFLLVGIMLFTAIPAEVSAAVSSDEASEEGSVYVGGMQMEAIEISDEVAEEIGIIRAEDFAAGGEQQYYSNTYGSQAYNSTWDVYSSNYIYNRLGEKERKLWDLMDAECRKYLGTAENAKLEMVDSNGWKRQCYVTKGIEFMSLGLTSQKASNVYMMFLYANPQYYFLDSAYLRSNSVLTPMLFKAFARGAARKSETQKMKAQIDKMKGQVEKGATDLEKARIAHDLIVRKVKYDHYYNTSSPSTPYHQSAYSVFCDSYTVCAGYTKAFEMLMNSVGIDALAVTSFKVTGLDGSGEGHAWNAVCLNDSWYYVDCTWDDMDGDGVNKPEFQYTWFGLSEATLTGSMDKSGFHKAESLYSGLLPKCTRDLGSTQDQVGTVYVPIQITAPPKITQKKISNGVKVTLKTATPGADIYYTIDGKAPSSSFSRSYHYTKAFKVNSDVTIKAVAVCNGRKDSEVVSAAVKGRQYTVKFNTMGGNKVSSQKVWPEETLEKPADPKRKGYKFKGWYSNRDCTIKWKFSNKITKNLTVYAKWTKVTVGGTAVKGLKNLPGRKMDVTIGKVRDVKGYQIRYSTKSNMKSSKKVYLTSNQIMISDLRAGSTYYVQARAYKLDSAKKKVYGKWSNIKVVTIRN